MNTQALTLKFQLIAGIILGVAFVILMAPKAHAAACTAPSTNYGTATTSVSIPATGTYRIWSRMAAANSTDNTYLLEVDGNTCYTVGGSGVPTYASGSTARFANNSTNWKSTTSTGSQIDMSLTAGSHTIKMIGNSADLVLDRVIFTQDTACTPSGTGDNCANPPDTTPPVVNITSPANGATVTSPVSVSANATDDSGVVSKVELYIGSSSTPVSTDTSSPFTSLSTGSLSPGSYTLSVKAYDAANNVSTSSSITVTVPDTTAPTISGTTSSSITQTSATITWTTNEASDSQVRYGTTTSYGSTTTLDTNRVTSHSVSLTGLTANTTYNYQVVSKDAAGNTAQSANLTFKTLAPAADTTAPSVSVTSPAGGATITGTTNITATASDNVGVVGVQFQVDGVNVSAEDTTSPYSVSWNPSSLSNGSHTIRAIARDAAGNTTISSTVTVTVNNPATNIADLNKDGVVNVLDFGALKVYFGQSGGPGDLNSDGSVNVLDFGVIKANFGK